MLLAVRPRRRGSLLGDKSTRMERGGATDHIAPPNRPRGRALVPAGLWGAGLLP